VECKQTKAKFHNTEGRKRIHEFTNSQYTHTHIYPYAQNSQCKNEISDVIFSEPEPWTPDENTMNHQTQVHEKYESPAPASPHWSEEHSQHSQTIDFAAYHKEKKVRKINTAVCRLVIYSCPQSLLNWSDFCSNHSSIFYGSCFCPTSRIVGSWKWFSAVPDLFNERHLSLDWCYCCCCPSSVDIPTTPYQWSCWLGRVGIVEVDYAHGQLHSCGAPVNSVWTISYKAERMVMGGWESVNLSHLFTRDMPKFGRS